MRPSATYGVRPRAEPKMGVATRAGASAARVTGERPSGASYPLGVPGAPAGDGAAAGPSTPAAEDVAPSAPGAPGTAPGEPAPDVAPGGETGGEAAPEASAIAQGEAVTPPGDALPVDTATHAPQTASPDATASTSTTRSADEVAASDANTASASGASRPDATERFASSSAVDADDEPASGRCAKPFLASEALMDELAPVEPGRRTARLWCAWLGAWLTLFGALPLVELRPGGLQAAVPSLVVGAIALVAARARVIYRQRAVAMVVLGLLTGIVGLHGTPVGAPSLSLPRLAPAIALSAAVVFRTRYRAYAGARVFLGIAIIVSLPFVGLTALDFRGGFGVAQVGSLVALAAIAASLSGFMGAETTGPGPYAAHGVILAFAIELALHVLFSPDGERTTATLPDVVSASLAFAGACMLASFGVFQILAWRFAADARRIDLHSPKADHEERRDSEVDWTTRG